MLPYLVLFMSLYFGRRSFLVSYQYILLVYSNLTYKESHVREENGMFEDYSSIPPKKGLRNLFNFYLRLDQHLPISDFFVNETIEEDEEEDKPAKKYEEVD